MTLKTWPPQQSSLSYIEPSNRWNEPSILPRLPSFTRLFASTEHFRLPGNDGTSSHQSNWISPNAGTMCLQSFSSGNVCIPHSFFPSHTVQMQPDDIPMLKRERVCDSIWVLRCTWIELHEITSHKIIISTTWVNSNHGDFSLVSDSKNNTGGWLNDSNSGGWDDDFWSQWKHMD